MEKWRNDGEVVETKWGAFIPRVRPPNTWWEACTATVGRATCLVG